MNKEIALVIANKIKDLPFIDVLAGMVKSVTTEQPSDASTKRVVFPVAYEIVKPEATECTSKSRDLVPNSKKKSIIYFEDFGANPTSGGRPGKPMFQSTIRLVAWFNRNRLVGDQYANISTFCQSAIIGLLTGKNPINTGNFQRLTFSANRLPPQDAGIFSRYTYDEATRQYLMPPYECFAIDFTCRFAVRDTCLSMLNFEGGKVC